MSNGFMTPGSGVSHSPFLSSSVPATPAVNSGYGLGMSPSAFGPSVLPSTPGRSTTSGLGPTWTPHTAGGAGAGVLPASLPGTPGMYATFPTSPSPDGNEFSMGSLPPRRHSGLLNGSDSGVGENLNLKELKKDD